MGARYKQVLTTNPKIKVSWKEARRVFFLEFSSEFFFILSITSPAFAFVVGEGAVVIGQTLVEGVVVVVVLIVGGHRHRRRLRKIVIVAETN